MFSKRNKNTGVLKWEMCLAILYSFSFMCIVCVNILGLFSNFFVHQVLLLITARPHGSPCRALY